MYDEHQKPQVFRLLQGEELDIQPSPTGQVGWVFCGDGPAAVWLAKQQEVIDEAWLFQSSIAVLIILLGQLWPDVEQTQHASMVWGAADLLIHSPHTGCRPYRLPRNRQEETIFLALYPVRYQHIETRYAIVRRDVRSCHSCQMGQRESLQL